MTLRDTQKAEGRVSTALVYPYNVGLFTKKEKVFMIASYFETVKSYFEVQHRFRLNYPNTGSFK